MQRRAFERIPANLAVRFKCCNTDCYGTVTNISKNGMLIRTEDMCFPCNSKFDVFIIREDVQKISVKVRHLTKSITSYDRIGVEVINPSQKYLELVDSLFRGAYAKH